MKRAGKFLKMKKFEFSHFTGTETGTHYCFASLLGQVIIEPYPNPRPGLEGLGTIVAPAVAIGSGRCPDAAAADAEKKLIDKLAGNKTRSTQTLAAEGITQW